MTINIPDHTAAPKELPLELLEHLTWVPLTNRQTGGKAVGPAAKTPAKTLAVLLANTEETRQVVGFVVIDGEYSGKFRDIVTQSRAEFHPTFEAALARFYA